MTLQPGTILGRYEVVSLLGSGGMGEVYRAFDAKLGRDVAIKVLPDALRGDRQYRRRLEREAKTISQLQHAHVCTLHDLDSVDGTDFLVMEYLQGETLADRLRRGPVPFAELCRIGKEVAEAVDAAHRRGLVHRDLKPGNVMLTPAGVKVLDFGLAKDVTEAVVDVETQAPTATNPLTGEGALVGTMPYMAPEQLEGRPADARTDIWALGCVLYEMATGERPFTGTTQASLISSIMTAAPDPPSRKQALTPESLDRLVSRCLEKKPDARWQSAADLGHQLGSLGEGADARSAPRRWVALAAALVVVVAVAGWLGMRSGSAPETAPAASDAGVATAAAETMVVVLPFESLGADDKSPLAEGLAVGIGSRLGAIDGVSIVSRKSAVQYAGSDKSPGEIGAELGAQWILDGVLQWATADRVRVTPALVRVGDGAQVWTEEYDRTLASTESIFDVQDEIAQRVSEAIGASLVVVEEAPMPTESLEAWTAYQTAVEILDRAFVGEEGWNRALLMLRRATELDPVFVLAWVRLGELETDIWGSSDRTPERAAAAQAAIDRALALDDQSPEVHRARGYFVMSTSPEDRDLALKELELAAAELPNDSRVFEFLGDLHRLEGAWEESLRAYERASVLD
ncbi:MAG: serine/threonine-protein kinase, partial [Thermoanaerobaculia bacterium]|nr:serine/threonine-protein kinase [Thermoanaerobaculia bacterium]